MTPSGSNSVNECGVILRDDGMTTKSEGLRCHRGLRGHQFVRMSAG